MAIAHPRNRRQKLWLELQSRLQQKAELEVHYSEYSGHSRELARDHAPAEGVVLSVGGDGTFNEILNGWMDQPERGQPNFVLVPLGTGNDFARDRGIEKDPSKLEKAVFEPTVTPTDLGSLCFRSAEGGRRCRYFVVGATIGFSAEVTRYFQTLPRVFPGTVQYLFSLLVSLIRWRNTQAQILSDSIDLESLDFFNLNLANSRYYGGGMYSSPLARPDDGRLEMVLMELGKFDVIKALPQNYNGKFHEVQGLLQHPIRRLSLESPRDLPVQADGEYLGTTPIEVEVVPQAFRLAT